MAVGGALDQATDNPTTRVSRAMVMDGESGKRFVSMEEPPAARVGSVATLTLPRKRNAGGIG